MIVLRDCTESVQTVYRKCTYPGKRLTHISTKSCLRSVLNVSSIRCDRTLLFPDNIDVPADIPASKNEKCTEGTSSSIEEFFQLRFSSDLCDFQLKRSP